MTFRTGKPLLLYSLYDGEYYGTERMSLATAASLAHRFTPVIIVPPGPAAFEARKLGLQVIETKSAKPGGKFGGMTRFDYVGFGAQLKPFFESHETFAFLATHAAHSLAFALLALRYRRDAGHINVVHGFDGDGYYRPLRLLNYLPVSFVAVSKYTRERLIANGVRSRKIRVIENFLTDDRLLTLPTREAFATDSIRRVALIARLAASKRLDLLLTCLERSPDLNSIAFHIYGDGPLRREIEDRVAAGKLNVVVEGFRFDVADELAKADVLVHLRSDDHLPLVLLEAFAAGVPTIVPDKGGASYMIEDRRSGLLFIGDDPDSLGNALHWLQMADAETLNGLSKNARIALRSRFSQKERIADYEVLINERFPGLKSR